MSPRLEALLETLRGLDRPSSKDLAHALGAPITFDDVRPFVRFDGESYVRSTVYKDEVVELRLLCWRAGQSTSLHGHGDSACAFRVIRGAATETVLGERDRVWSPSSVVAEDRPRVHQVVNAHKDALLTLHAYCPPLPVDAPSSLSGRQIVIVGGGFSGLAVAYHLLKNGVSSTRIHVVESGPWLGGGIAFGVESELFRLNVPASKMSIDPAVPLDFVRFAEAEADPNAFLSRALYRRYVTARFAGALCESPAKLRLWRDEAVSVTGSHVLLRSGRRLEAETVVLATGLTPHIGQAVWDPGVIDAWDECALATLPRSGHLLLVGSGLSALDVLAFLEHQHFEGTITLVSRHGLLPLPHEHPFQGTTPFSGDDMKGAPNELLPLMRWVRERVRATSDVPWQRAVDRLRPHVTALYHSLGMRDRARFVRHVRPYWDVVRHRAPPDTLARVERMQSEGRLRRLAGRVKVMASREGDVQVEIRERDGEVTVERFSALVRCIGPVLHAAEGETLLLRSLLDGGLARMTSQGLGVETDKTGQVLDANGHASGRIWGMGAVRRASHWETTSVPDIAVHAQKLAAEILGRG